MDREISHNGWRWDEVTDLAPWKLPDGFVLQTAYEIGNNPPKRIYDLGCGIGRHTILFAQQNHEVYASDISDTAISRTQSWLDELGLSAKLQQGHFLEVKFPENFFDLVVSINTINHGLKAEVWGIIEAVYKMLKPGGIFLGTLRIKSRDTPFYSTDIEVLDDQTFMFIEGEDREIPHYFAYLDEIPDMFHNYKLEFGSFMLIRTYEPPFTAEHLNSQYHSENFRFKVMKPRSPSEMVGNTHNRCTRA